VRMRQLWCAFIQLTTTTSRSTLVSSEGDRDVEMGSAGRGPDQDVRHGAALDGLDLEIAPGP
jgi:hypothetical protein